MRTPWGMSDHAEVLFKEIIHHSTPNHGGIAVPVEYHKYINSETVERNAENPESYGTGTLWFEEDCAYLLPLLEIKASLNELSVDELKKSIKAAIYFYGVESLIYGHPLYQMILDNAEDEDVKSAISRAISREGEEKLYNSPGGIVCRMKIDTEHELLTKTKEIHRGEANNIEELRRVFKEKGLNQQFELISDLLKEGRLVFTYSRDERVFIERFGGDKHIHVDQYEKADLVLLR